MGSWSHDHSRKLDLKLRDIQCSLQQSQKEIKGCIVDITVPKEG